MIQPKPFKFICQKCGYIKIVKQKSDVLDPQDLINICVNCNSTMKKEDLNFFENIKSIFY